MSSCIILKSQDALNNQINSDCDSNNYICCVVCSEKIHLSAFSLIRKDLLCEKCKGKIKSDKTIQSNKGTLKICGICQNILPLKHFLLMNTDYITLYDNCDRCRDMKLNVIKTVSPFNWDYNIITMKKYDNDVKSDIKEVVESDNKPILSKPSSNPSSPSSDNSNTYRESVSSDVYRSQPFKGKPKRFLSDICIPYSELRQIVNEDVYKGLHDDRFDELIVFAANPQEIIDIIPNDIERKEKILEEVVTFYKYTREKVKCKSCKKQVIKADCFLHHTSFICRECSMRIAPQHLDDWTSYSTLQLKCGRCKHFAAYHKFLKFNGRGEIKRQNTCAFCCLKKWREYYLGIRSY